MGEKPGVGESQRTGPLNARVWAKVYDSADQYHRTQAMGVANAPPRSSRTDHQIVRLVNGTGYNLRQGEVVEVDDYALANLTNDYLYFNSATPDTTRQIFAIMLQPQLTGGNDVQPALVRGVCKALVNVTDTGHKFAVVESGLRVLQSAAAGPVKILHPLPPGDTGETVCMVDVGCCEAETGVPFRNESTYEVPAYGVMRVVGYDATLKEFRTERPHADHFHSIYLINGATAVPGATGDPLEYSSGTGYFQGTTGLTIACSGSPSAYGECWGPTPGSFLLRQHGEGFYVLRGAGTGLVRAFPYEVFSGVGKVPSTISKGSTGTVYVYYGSSGSEADSGFRITCNARFNAITSTTKFVEIKRWNGQWYVGPLEC